MTILAAIESWWRVLKHQWLYLNTLDTARAVEKLVAFYVHEHNSRLPHSAFRGQKRQWLFLNTLDTVSALERLVAFYVQEHNTRLPHSAFRGQTPDEMYFGTGTSVPKQLETAWQAARQARMEANRKSSCQTCEPPTEVCS